MEDRELHEAIRRRIEAELGRRTWAWLAQESGIPQSTLAGQVSRRRFSLDVLVKISRALGRPPADFLPVEPAAELRPDQFQRAMEKLEDALSDLRGLAG